MSPTRFAAAKPFQGTSTIATSIACSSKNGRYWRVVIRLSPEQIRVVVDSLIWSRAWGSQVSYSSHWSSNGSTALAIRSAPSVRKL